MVGDGHTLMCEPLYFLIIKLAYVFSAQDESLPNFVVFRGSVGKKVEINWRDDVSGLPLKKQTIKIKNYQNKGKTLRLQLSVNISSILFISYFFEGLKWRDCTGTNVMWCEKEVSAHNGFMTITATHLIPDIFKALKTSKSKVTYVTGHSLGGAMATITSGFAFRKLF